MAHEQYVAVAWLLVALIFAIALVWSWWGLLRVSAVVRRASDNRAVASSDHACHKE